MLKISRMYTYYSVNCEIYFVYFRRDKTRNTKKVDYSEANQAKKQTNLYNERVILLEFYKKL